MIIKELSLSGDQNPIGNDSLPNEKPKKSSPHKRKGRRKEREGEILVSFDRALNL